MYSLEELKHAAAKGIPLVDMTTQESVVFYTYRYCYRAYKMNPTDETKQRLAEFVKPVVKRCLGKDET